MAGPELFIITEFDFMSITYFENLQFVLLLDGIGSLARLVWLADAGMFFWKLSPISLTFYEQIFANYFPTKTQLQIISCITKKLIIKCWQIWDMKSISTTFYKQFFTNIIFPKNYKTLLTVNRKKLSINSIWKISS